MTAKKLKIHACVSMCPIVAILTLGIYPLIILVILIVNYEKFNSKGLVIATFICGLFLLFIIPGWICSFFLKPKSNNNSSDFTYSSNYKCNKCSLILPLNKLSQINLASDNNQNVYWCMECIKKHNQNTQNIK